MQRPPSLLDFDVRSLAPSGQGIVTFSNGSQWDGWADRNCFACQFYDHEGPAGDGCAFEGAALLHVVSPELARLFGWTESATYPGSFTEPRDCPWRADRAALPVPFEDPQQFSLLDGAGVRG